METEAAARSDQDALLALNRDYIDSVQNGDTRRFEEILADDFLCSNPDGSLVDREAFLAQTARAVAIRGLAAEDVLCACDGRCRHHPRANELHHRRGRATQRPLHRCLGAARRAVARGVGPSRGDGQPFLSQPRAPCCQ